MKTPDEKLTLKLKRDSIQRAKAWAKQRGTSVSRMVEDYFDHVAPPSPVAAELGISANLRSLIGKIQARDAAGLRQKITPRVLRVEARLDRVPTRANLRLAQRQRTARGNKHLPFDEIDAGDHFGHRVLDLKPRIHFEKIKGIIIGR